MDFLDYFKSDIKKQLVRQYELFKEDNSKGSEMFLNIIKKSRDNYFKFVNDNNLNHSSFGGILLEWIFKLALDVFIENLKKSDKIEVINNFKLYCPWRKKDNNNVVDGEVKKSQFSKINIDIAIKDKKTGKFISFIELKAVFDKGFPKFIIEKNEIESNTDVLELAENFKYHYVSFSDLRNIKGCKNTIENLRKNEQLWYMKLVNIKKQPKMSEEVYSYTNKIDEEMKNECSNMLKSLYSVIENYE